MPGNHNEIGRRLWVAAHELRANSKLKAAKYSVPVPALETARIQVRTA